MSFVEFVSHILNIKFQDHETSDSGVEDFLKFLPYMGIAAILAL